MSVQGNRQGNEISSDEKFKQSVAKLRPYFQNLWKARRRIIIINSAVLILTLVYLLFLTESYYRSTVIILPDYGSKESTLSSLASLASLAGVNVGSGSPMEVYRELLTSEAVLSPVIYAKYKTKKYPEPVNLIQYFELEPDEGLPPDQQKRKMFLTEFKDLSKSALATDVGRTDKILTVAVTMPEAQLSADVANKVVESLDSYIRTKRKSYSSEQRKYIEKRLGQVKDSLSLSENRLLAFKERNRAVYQSPALLLEQTRLTRSAEILNAVYLELSKQLELAKIDEVKDTPVLNVQEFAQNPVIKAGPRRRSALVIIMFLSLFFTIFFAMFWTDIKKYYGFLRGKD